MIKVPCISREPIRGRPNQFIERPCTYFYYIEPSKEAIDLHYFGKQAKQR